MQHNAIPMKYREIRKKEMKTFADREGEDLCTNKIETVLAIPGLEAPCVPRSRHQTTPTFAYCYISISDSPSCLF